MKLIHRGKVREVFSFEGGFPTHSDFKYRTEKYYVDNRGVYNSHNDASVGSFFDDGELEQVIEASRISSQEFDRILNKVFRGGSN